MESIGQMVLQNILCGYPNIFFSFFLFKNLNVQKCFSLSQSKSWTDLVLPDPDPRLQDVVVRLLVPPGSVEDLLAETWK